MHGAPTGRSADVCARLDPSIVRTASHILIVVFALTSGCATRVQDANDASDAPSLVQIMQRLKEAQEAYRKMAEAGHSVTTALGVANLDIDLSAFDIPQLPKCPPEVQSHLQADDDYQQKHDERLARALVMLDEEVARDGGTPLGCRPD